MEQSPRRVRFGVFEVDLKAGELRKSGRKLRIQDKPLRLLEMLLEHPGEAVTREELRARLWPSDTFIDFDNGLNNSVNKLRRALGDSAAAPRFIETLGRRGYRFIGTAEAVPAARNEVAASAGLTAAAPSSSTAVQGAVPVLEHPGRATQVTVESLAVLPLANLSSDPEQEYFSDGMTDALITQLAQIRPLRVISRQSTLRYKRSEKSLVEIGRELDVDAIVEGTVVRAGDRVRITAQLVEAAADRHIWSEQYEGDIADLIELQSQIARDVAARIRQALGREAAPGFERVSPKAYDAFLRGRHLWNRRSEEGLRRALDYYREAAAIEPGFAMAHAAIAETYGPLGYFGFVPPEEAIVGMKSFALKALELDEQMAEAWTALGACAAFHEWDWSAAEKHFRRAIEINPNYTTAYMWYGHLLENIGRQDENLALRRRAASLAPLTAAADAALGYALMMCGRVADGIRQMEAALELHPDFWVGHEWLGIAYLVANSPHQAVPHFEAGGRDGSLGYAYGIAGERKKALALLQELEQIARLRYVSPWEFALLHLGLEQRHACLEWLERGYETRAVKLCRIKTDPRLASLRQEPRFTALLSRMNLANP